MEIKNYIVLLVMLMMVCHIKAQDVAVKTNLPVDATATVNAGIELGLSSRWTLDLSGSFNAWNVSGVNILFPALTVV